MLENLVTKTWRYLKTLSKKSKIEDILFPTFFLRYGIEPVIGFLERKKKMILFPEEQWGTKLRYLLRWYEYGSVKVCKRFLQPGMNALDIGGDIGYFSRLFSELVGPKGQVWAFEPYPDSYNLLKKNIAFPKYQNVIPIKKAISDSTGKIKFFGMDLPAKHGLYDASKISSGLSLKESLIVESTTIDDFLLSLGDPEINFIKMDIEGAEPKALAGMAKTVARLKKITMIIEFNVTTLQLGGNSPSSFLKQLKNMGFKIQAIQPDGRLKAVDRSVWQDAKEGYVNLLCLKDK